MFRPTFHEPCPTERRRWGKEPHQDCKTQEAVTKTENCAKRWSKWKHNSNEWVLPHHEQEVLQSQLHCNNTHRRPKSNLKASQIDILVFLSIQTKHHWKKDTSTKTNPTTTLLFELIAFFITAKTKQNQARSLFGKGCYSRNIIQRFRLNVAVFAFLTGHRLIKEMQ